MLTLQLIDIKNLAFNGTCLHRAGVVITIIGIVTAAAAACCALIGLRVRQHNSYPPMAAAIQAQLDESYTADLVTANIITLYMQAADENQKINDERARPLRYSGTLVVASLVIAVAGQLLTRFT